MTRPDGVQTPRLRSADLRLMDLPEFGEYERGFEAQFANDPAGPDFADAVFLAAQYSLVADPWQQLILRDWLAKEPTGHRWMHLSCGLSVPRQNGKNALVEIRELFGMIAYGEKFLHTAHEVKTARKAFKRLQSFFTDQRRYPELARMVVEIRQTNGQEAIVLENGGSVEFAARTRGSGRGFTVDTIIFDEAQHLTDEQQEAILPTSSAAPSRNPQWIYIGTPPVTVSEGDVFRRVRQAGFDGDARTTFSEWSAAPGSDFGDDATTAMANPGLGLRLQYEVCDGEYSQMSEAGYGRERLGMWEDSSTSQVIPEDSWEWCEDVESMAVDRLVLAVDVSPDRSTASVALAGLRADGLVHIELWDQRRGVSWVPAMIQEKYLMNPISAVVVDERSPARNLVDEFKRRKVRKILTTSAGDMAGACAGFFDAVVSGQLRHTGQPQLDNALKSARKRTLLDNAWGWNRRNEASDITPLVSCTLAFWGVASAKVRTNLLAGSEHTGEVTVL